MKPHIELIVAMLVTNGLIYKAAVRGSDCRPYDYDNPVAINVTHEVQNLSSPNYPNAYTENLECYWLLRVPSGQTLHLYLKDFDVVCGNDFLIINKNAIKDSLYEGCWENGTETFINATVNTGVRFQSNNHDNGRGFLLLFSSNKDTLQTYITSIDNSPGGGSGGPDVNKTGSNNGTLGSNNFAVGIYEMAGGFTIIFSIGLLCLEAFRHLYL